MGYEQSPAVDLVATNCALCGRPLLDADSVECGMGPTCRARYGAGGPGTAGNATEALALSARLPEALRERAEELVRGGDGRALANWAVNRIAALGGAAGDDVADELVLVVAAAGYVKLAAALAERHSRAVVNVGQEGAELTVSAPYNPTFTENSRRVRGRRWDREAKVFRFPASERIGVWRELVASFGAGTMVVGANGMRRI